MNQLICRDCKKTYSLDTPSGSARAVVCWISNLRAVFDLERIRSRPPTLWRYREALPLARDENQISLGEGFTPLVPVDFGGRKVLVKQDQLFPTGSYKDRGAAVLISKVKELGIREVVEDSSGNAGCAVAAYCAAGGIALPDLRAGKYRPGKTGPNPVVRRRPQPHPRFARGYGAGGDGCGASRCITPAIPGIHSSFTAQRPGLLRWWNSLAGRRRIR